MTNLTNILFISSIENFTLSLKFLRQHNPKGKWIKWWEINVSDFEGRKKFFCFKDGDQENKKEISGNQYHAKIKTFNIMPKI